MGFFEVAWFAVLALLFALLFLCTFGNLWIVGDCLFQIYVRNIPKDQIRGSSFIPLVGLCCFGVATGIYSLGLPMPIPYAAFVVVAILDLASWLLVFGMTPYLIWDWFRNRK